MNKIYILGLILPLLLVNQRSNAQGTNPAPYCYPTAVNMTAGSCTTGAGINLQSVKLNTLSQAGSCYGSSNTDVYRYWSSTTTLNGGSTYTSTVTTPYSASGYSISAGIWIDFNQNGRFEAAELMGSDLSKNNSNAAGLYHNLTFTVPCSATAGKTRMRVRSQYNTKVSAADTCSCPGGYGETWDFDVTIVQPSSVSAGFTCPSQAFVKTVIKFVNINQTGYIEHAWDLDNNGTWDQKGVNPDFKTTLSTWTTPGTKCARLRSTNCFGTDSILKCISIVTPTTVPVADFQSCERVIEIYSGVNLIDLSSNGAYIWKWNIYDSATFKGDPIDPISDESSGYVVYSNGTNKNSQNPRVDFYRTGVYTLELTATNGIGSSAPTKKKFYIKVTLPTSYFLGFGAYGKNNDNRVESNFGTIMDDGGLNGNYGNNQGVATKSFLTINPAALRPIAMEFRQIKLKDINDSIFIYDDDRMNKSKLMDVLTYNDNGTYPVYNSTLNKMHVYFKSNGSGVDSGYIARFSNTGSFSSSKLNIALGHNILFVNKNSVFYDENQTEYSGNFDKVWSVNDTVQSGYNNMDTLKYKFKYAGTQKVCLEMRGCSDTFKNCKNLVFASGIMGVTYKDNNSNCQFGTGDTEIKNINVKLYDSTLNKWAYFMSDPKGAYNFNKGTGGYKLMIDTLDLPFKVKCRTPGVDSAFRLTSSAPLKVVDFDIACKSGYDLGVQSIWTQRVAFPGRNHDLRVYAGDMNKWFGLNCTSGLNGTVVVSVSGKVTYLNKVSGSLTPSSISGNVFTYTISDFSAINGATDFGLEFMTDTTAKAGDTICVSVTVSPSSSDYNTSNNTVNYCYLVRNSYDPNMKEVYPEEITQGYKDWLIYTVHFQNTGNAEAYDIRIADTLDSKLDMNTFQLMNYSHPVATTLKDNVLSFTFKNIMLPDSNFDEKGSHGFVQYRIKPKANLPKGAVIKNTAFIYFDFNDPVVTNTVDNEIYPKYVVIPDKNFAGWLDKKYPGAIRKGNLLDTSWADIKNEVMVNVRNKSIANLFGIQFFNSLKVLDCSGNQLTNLPELPSKLSSLVCGNNMLTGLPTLPSGLAALDCLGNGLTSMPALPSSLLTLTCEDNKLTKLPLLPGTLTILHCKNNLLTELPVLPALLNEMDCGNNKISCFEKFSESLSILNINGNINKCLPNYIGAMDATTKAMPLCIKGDVINNPGNCKSFVPPSVFIPDVNFAAWLSAIYPGCMHNGNWMDTSCSDIKNATSINVGSKSIANLFGIQFFTSLKTLNCSANTLAGLPQLPGTVTHLNCQDNKITSLPALPKNLQALLCDNNSLTALPVLPSILDYLSCSNNFIVSLPVLPTSLKNLYCDFNQLDALPSLPAGLLILHCENNKLVDLPVLPSSLSQLYCDNNKIICFDKFSDNISAIDISGNKYKCLPNYIAAMDAATKATALCIKDDSINNPDKCLSTLQISVKQISYADNLKVYPNPGKGIFNIEIPENLNGGNVSISVYNALGAQVYNAIVEKGLIQIDIRNQPNGLYILKVNGTDFIINKCLIKD